MYKDYNVREETRVFRAYMYDVIQGRFGLCPSATSAVRVLSEVERFNIYPADLETGLIVTVDYDQKKVQVANCRAATGVAWAVLGIFKDPEAFGAWFDDWCRVMALVVFAKNSSAVKRSNWSKSK